MLLPRPRDKACIEELAISGRGIQTSSWRDSNPRHTDYRSVALPTALQKRVPGEKFYKTPGLAEATSYYSVVFPLIITLLRLRCQLPDQLSREMRCSASLEVPLNCYDFHVGSLHFTCYPRFMLSRYCTRRSTGARTPNSGFGDRRVTNYTTDLSVNTHRELSNRLR